MRDDKDELVTEARYFNGLLYRQNRSHDLEMCFDDFIDRVKTTKRLAEKEGYMVFCDLVEADKKWIID